MNMSIDKILVLMASLVGILLTYWFFLKKEHKQVEATDDEVDITVEGGYKPASIIIPFGKTTKLTFFRKDPSNCLEEVVLGDFKIRKLLPLHEKVTLEVIPQKKGEFGFSCGMGMFHGKLIVK